MLDDEERKNKRFRWTDNDIPGREDMVDYATLGYVEDRFVSDLMFASVYTRSSILVECFCGDEIYMVHNQMEAPCSCGARVHKAVLAQSDHIGLHLSATMGGILMVAIAPDYKVVDYAG